MTLRPVKTSHSCTLFIAACAMQLLFSCSPKETENHFYHVEEGRIVREGAPVYFIGTNVWYAPVIALSDPDRLCRELDSLKAAGMWNLRVMATEPETEGLAILLDEMEKREMAAVLYLNNSWEWTDTGYRSYLRDAGAGPQPHPSVDGYGAYVNAMSEFASNEKAVALFHEHVKAVVGRFKDSKAIFSWQICNEPRPFSEDKEKVDAFAAYIESTARLIKSIDHNHMVSTGSEGAIGCNNGDMALMERIHAFPEIDYINVHIWPYNWSWVKENNVVDGLETAIANSRKYIDEHLAKAYDLRKPIVVEEFGYPRDGFEWDNDAPTTARDAFYGYIFSRVLASAREGGQFAGCNFWAWSGEAGQNKEHRFWQEGDDLCGDPSQEAQGLNGVYLQDSSTMAVIRAYNDTLRNMPVLWAPIRHKWLYLEGDEPVLTVKVSSVRNSEAVEVKVAMVSDTTLMSAHPDTVIYYTEAVSPPADVNVDVSSLVPGFYRTTVEAGKSGLSFNIGVEPEKISSPQDKKEDFDEFWAKNMEELAAVPLDAELTEVPEYSNEIRKTYTVRMTSIDGGVCGGILTIPVKEGKYPVSVEFMGYGASVYYRDPSADPERINFLASTREQGIFEVQGGGWADEGLPHKETYYYKGAFCDVVRIMDFLCSLDKADDSRIFAWGDSQGGAFTWISASLDHRVRAIAPSVPFLGDYPDYGKIVWWPVHEIMEYADAGGFDRAGVYDMLTYFDLKNFADRVECPVYMAFGLQDPVCPPHTNFSIYNMARSEKKWYCVPTCGHSMWNEKEWQKERAAFFESFL